jgi:hypothetical protein
MEPLKVPVTTADQAASVVPSSSTPAGGSRRYILDEILVTNRATGNWSDNLARFKVSIPSARLHVKVTLGYKPYDGEFLVLPPSGISAWKMDIREFARTDKGQYIAGGLVVQGLVLSDSWEAVTLSREWRGAVTVPLTHLDSESVEVPGTGLLRMGDLHVVAEWEPAAGDAPIGDVELAGLFSACHLTIDTALVVFSNAPT